MTYESEDQQVEAIKKWWKENGKSLIVGVVLGLGGLYGWQAYNAQQAGAEAAASAAFEQYRTALDNEDAELAEGHGRLLQGEYGDSVYAFYAKLLEAGQAAAAGQHGKAANALQWAVDNAPDQALMDLARLRLARVQLANRQTDSAASQLAQINNSSLTVEVERLRGDIAVAKGDKAGARSAYEKALAADNGTMQELLEMQLSDLGVASES